MTETAPGRCLDVVVLSCGALGVEVANRLQELDEVGRVALVRATYRRKALSSYGKVRHVVRYQGWVGLARLLARKLVPARGPAAGEGDGTRRPADGIALERFDDFHHEECLAWLREFDADLGVLAGTYILRDSVFSIPRMGSINLHTGKAPEYRGAAPAFWELYNGETEVGVTIHEVTADLDAGRILLRETFPLDPAPDGDPMEYVRRMRRDVLLPNGVRMMAEAVAGLARGSVDWTVQDPSRAKTYRTPDHRAIKQLRRRVAARRRGAA